MAKNDKKTCNACGAVIDDRSAVRCPSCNRDLGTWETIDEGWGEEEAVLPGLAPGETPASSRTLVGMGAAGFEPTPPPGPIPGIPATDAPPDAPTIRVPPPVLDESELPSVVVSANAEEPEGLPTMPMALPVIDEALEVAGVSRLETARTEVGDGPGRGLATLPPDGMPDFAQGLPTLQTEAAAFAEQPTPQPSSVPTTSDSFTPPVFEDASVAHVDAELVKRSKQKAAEGAASPPPPATPAKETAVPPGAAPAAKPAADASAPARPPSYVVNQATQQLPPPRRRNIGLWVLWTTAIATLVAAALLFIMRAAR